MSFTQPRLSQSNGKTRHRRYSEEDARRDERRQYLLQLAGKIVLGILALLAFAFVTFQILDVVSAPPRPAVKR